MARPSHVLRDLPNRASRTRTPTASETSPGSSNTSITCCNWDATRSGCNPLYESPFRDAGYDISDYKKVAARYGTNDDLAALFAAAHARGMHVLLDLVPGHTSNEHPWFRQSATDSPNLYDDRYIWTGNWIEGGDGLPFIGGEEARDGAYIVNFFAFQPALNYGFAHPRKGWQAPALGDEALRTCDAMLDVMRFWLDMGADGFRVDMADSLVKGDDEGKPITRSAPGSHMLGQIRGEYPEAAFVSEWGRPDEAFEAGFDMDFYLDWRWDGVANGYSMLLRDTDTPMLRDGDTAISTPIPAPASCRSSANTNPGSKRRARRMPTSTSSPATTTPCVWCRA